MQPAADARDVPLAQFVAATLDEVDGEGVEQLVGNDDALDGVGLGEPVSEERGAHVVAARGEGGALFLDASGVAVEDGDARGGWHPGARARSQSSIDAMNAPEPAPGSMRSKTAGEPSRSQHSAIWRAQR